MSLAASSLLDLLQVIPEPGFGRAPVRHRVAVRLAGALELRLVPIHVDRRIALDVERFLVGFAQPGVEHEFGRAARVAHALRLVERHVVGHAVLGLARGEALHEHRAAVLQAVEDRPVELRRIGNRDLRDEGRPVAGEEGFGDGLLLGVLALRGGAEHVHVVAAQHRRRVGVLAAGVGVDLRVQHQRLDVGTILEDHLRGVLVADVAHAAVAADDPDLRQLEDLLVGHHRVAEVRRTRSTRAG